ncbi:MAG: LON peptidase substrate-binding domain-containing protein, partial [Clostridia bacterium]
MPSKKIKYETLPILPLRGLMVFPHMVLHFDVGRPKSLAALESAMTGDQQVFLVAQYDADEDNPSRKDCCAVGTVSRVKQVLKLPGDNIRVLVEGISRAKLRNIVSEDPFLLGEITHMQDRSRADTLTLEALLRTTQQFFDAYAHASGRISNETLASVGEVEDPAKLADIIAANVLTRLEDRQHILELADIGDRLEALCGILARETELTGIEKQVQARVKQQVEKNQKDYFLREQIKAIQTELGDHESTDVEDLREKLEKTPLNDEARERAQRELDRLSRMAPGSPEITVSRTYVEWILELPWGKESKDDLDLARARRILDEDHYGLKDVKERI